MKIGVLTFWHGNGNYGMLLQCWALQEVLKRMGHDPFVIRYSGLPIKSFPRKVLETVGLYNVFLFLTNRERYKSIQIKKRRDKLRGFDVFRKLYLSFSPKIYHTLKRIQKNPPVADCYIVGSDQVWSQLPDNEDHRTYYLNFGDKKARRISYAPSFGYDNYPPNLLPLLAKELRNFDALSCRENSGIEICRQAGFEAAKTLDPTMLLEKEDYESKLEDVSITLNPYVFIYSLNINCREDIRYEELKDYLNKNKLDLIVTPGDGYHSGREIFEGVTYSYSTIGQWLSNIYNSSMVITPSFHGIVFSIIFEKPFIYVPLKGHHANSNGRIKGLLQDLGLEDRMLNDDTSYDKLIRSTIDWVDVKSKLDILRNKSVNFLCESICEQ